MKKACGLCCILKFARSYVLLMCVLTWVDWHGQGETALLTRSRTPCEQRKRTDGLKWKQFSLQCKFKCFAVQMFEGWDLWLVWSGFALLTTTTGTFSNVSDFANSYRSSSQTPAFRKPIYELCYLLTSLTVYLLRPPLFSEKVHCNFAMIEPYLKTRHQNIHGGLNRKDGWWRYQSMCAEWQEHQFPSLPQQHRAHCQLNNNHISSSSTMCYWGASRRK